MFERDFKRKGSSCHITRYPGHEEQNLAHITDRPRTVPSKSVLPQITSSQTMRFSPVLAVATVLTASMYASAAAIKREDDQCSKLVCHWDKPCCPGFECVLAGQLTTFLVCVKKP
ncbi:hypothetical protein P692DRAFT_20832012 [Suillus brevipes Sb2]|nr:hypothetical protein P692DRAFT_20832012 [Suillus brevipes Sb2]